MMPSSEKPNCGTKNSTAFVDHTKNHSIKYCAWIGHLNAAFAQRGI